VSTQVPDYKSTLNLPETAFPMKANLPQREPEQIKTWDSQRVYQKMIERNQGKPTYAMPDGPPYANGNIHVGHCLNKILKDFVIKYKNMSGFQAVFIPGWDCHGLPIEHQVTKNLGSERKNKSDQEVRQMCRDYAEKYVGLQRDQFKRLGILGDWERPYKTLDPSYESANMVELSKIADKGNLYRGEKPVYWCSTCVTALAEAEVEYAEHKSPSIYVKFEMKPGQMDRFKLSLRDKSYVMIWTTTPWTLPANLAISVHSDFEYGIYCVATASAQAGGPDTRENWIIAKDLKPAVEKATGRTFHKELAVVKGSELEGLVTKHPFVDRDSPVILGEHVTLEAGTGAVHTAPGHGQEDYQIGLKYRLPVYNPVDDYGKFTDKVPEYQGKKVFETNPLIVQRLKETDHLAAVNQIQHSYPHCWRCKNPIIFRATPQWFIAMDGLNGSPKIRQAALEAIKKVKWVPSWGENRITAMVTNRPDWCISRQRLWGVPIPVLYCTSCNQAKADSRTMLRAAAIVDKKGLEGWYEADVKEISGGEKCTKCGGTNYKKGRDILDVWFDSGVCYAAVQEKRKGLTVPADLYLEGSDQHRGWFQSSLLAAISARGISPFKTVVTHGFVNDGEGKKMSKSVGNVLDPHKVIATSGAEILRLWSAFEDYTTDLTAGQESFDRVTETYRRVRNTSRYMLGNLNDFAPSKDSVPYENLQEIDRWALTRLAHFIEECHQAYEAFEFHAIYQALQNYFTVDLSAVYLDVLKDRLYTFKKTSAERRSSQTVIHTILKTVTSVIAPIMSFLAEEVHQLLPEKGAESIFLNDYPQVDPKWKNQSLEKTWEKLLELRTLVLKPLEEARQGKMIGSGLEARVILEAGGEFAKLARQYEKFLDPLFIVSQVEFKETKEGPVKVSIEKAQGEKCVRCWHYSPDTGKNQRFPGVCPKCVTALS